VLVRGDTYAVEEPPTRLAGLKTGSPEFKSTTWLGFVSDGNSQAVYYLDNIRLSNSTEPAR